MRQAVEIEDADKCNLCNECVKYTKELELPNSIRIDERDDRFIFTVESTGALPPETIVLKAFEVLAEKVKTIKVFAY